MQEVKHKVQVIDAISNMVREKKRRENKWVLVVINTNRMDVGDFWEHGYCLN